MAFVPTGGIIKLTQKGRLIYGEVSKEPQLVSLKKGGYFAKFSVVAGADKDGEKQYIDCKVFGNGLVNYCKDLQRGDPFCGIGDLESREYEGKTYWDLKLAWCNSPNVVPDMGDTAATLAQTAKAAGEATADGPQFTEMDDDDLEDGLPF